MWWEREPHEGGFQMTWLLLHLSAAALHVVSARYHLGRLQKWMREHDGK